VEKCYFIEIDPEVIEVSREFFPTVACSIDDPRVEIRNMDGAEFVKQRRGDMDAVIVDSTDPIGFARTLFGDTFFKAITEALSPEGMFVTHSDSLLLHSDIVHEVQQSMRKFFPVVDLYMGPTATYPGNWWAYNVGSMKLSPRDLRRPYESETRFYSDEMHERSFLPEKFYKRVVEGKLNW
jgi:spermidine synthase